MGELINFRDYKAKKEKEFQDFWAEMEELAKRNGCTLEDELTFADPIVCDYYKGLLHQIDKLDQWEAMSNENSINRKDAKRQRFGR